MPHRYDAMTREELIRALHSLSEKKPEGAAGDATLIHELRVHQIELELQNRELRDAQQLLEESRSRYADLYDLAPIGYCTLDPGGRVLEANVQAARLFDETRASLVGRPLTSVVSMKDPKAFREHLRECAAGGGPVTTEVTLRRRNGDRLVVQMVSTAFASGGGGETCKTTLTDVTGFKLSEERMRLRARTSEVLAASLDESSTLRAVTELLVPMLADVAFVDVVDADDRVLRYDALAELQPAVPLAERAPQAAVLRSGEPVLVATGTAAALAAALGHVPRTSEGAPVTGGSLMLVPLRARGHVVGVFTFAMTQSGRRYTSTDLALAQDLASRTAMAIDNAQLYQTAQRAVRAREDVLAVVSHDLKNPLMAIRLSAESMRLKKLDAVQSEKRVDAILRAVRGMFRLIGDLLDLAQIEAGHLTLERQRQDARVLGSEILELWRPLAEVQQVTLDVKMPDEPVPIVFDRDRILQVFSNLVGNALKFTPAGGRVSIEMVPGPEAAWFTVRDTGQGIQASALPHIFDRYWQSQKLRRGTGLGLYIAKGIIEAHGGTIDAESREGAGTTISFSLPLAVGPARASAGPVADGAPVLIIDDDEDLGEAMSVLLEERGYRVELVGNGIEALRYLQSDRRRPCLILLDLKMPLMDGWRLGAELKADPALAAIPLVVISAATDLAAEAASLGAAGWVAKPVRMESLLEAVRSQLGYAPHAGHVGPST